MTGSAEHARGEVWWFEPPDEPRRPFVILTRTTVLPYLSHVVAAPLTRTERDIPTEVALHPDDGVPVECVVQLDNLTRLSPAFLSERLTTLSPTRMLQICRAARIAIDC